MSLFNQLKDSVNKENLMALKDKALQIGQQLQKKETPSESTEEEESEKGAKMLQVMDWAFDKANARLKTAKNLSLANANANNSGHGDWFPCG